MHLGAPDIAGEPPVRPRGRVRARGERAAVGEEDLDKTAVDERAAHRRARLPARDAVELETDDGAQEMGASHLDCPLCVLTGAPPPAPPVVQLPQPQPLGHALQSIPAARIAAATAAPLPARGPPAL